MRIGYLECFSGISGDMLLGALVDSGVPFILLEETATALNVGARLEMRKVSRGGISGTKVDVFAGNQSAEAQHVHDHSSSHSHKHRHADGTVHTHEHVQAEHTHSPGHTGHVHTEHSHAEHTHARHRSLSSILAIIAAAPIADAVKARASRAFQLLGEAEARIHSMPLEQVHFHEVGAVDTIVDIVCSA